MKSLIIGANGGVGQHLVRKLKARDVDFTAGVRKEEQVEFKSRWYRCNLH